MHYFCVLCRHTLSTGNLLPTHSTQKSSARPPTGYQRMTAGTDGIGPLARDEANRVRNRRARYLERVRLVLVYRHLGHPEHPVQIRLEGRSHPTQGQEVFHCPPCPLKTVQLLAQMATSPRVRHLHRASASERQDRASRSTREPRVPSGIKCFTTRCVVWFVDENKPSRSQQVSVVCGIGIGAETDSRPQRRRKAYHQCTRKSLGVHERTDRHTI